MATVEHIVVRIGADITDFSRNLQRANSEMASFGSRMSGMGRNISSTFGATTLAIGGALAFSVKKAADFDTAIRKASVIAGATAKEFDAMKAAALDLGATTSLSASEVATAMSSMAAKGFTANQTIAAMPGIISAAEASGEDLALTADTISSALNTFGLGASESSRVADILAEVANKTAAGITDMQYAFKYAAPIADSLGISIEELAASTGILADAGIRGEQAGTSLRSGILALIKPAEKTSKMMEAMGVQVEDSSGKFVGISGLIKNITKSMEGMTDTQKLATLSQMVGTEAASSFLTLMKAGPTEIDRMTTSLENSAGASEKNAKAMKAGIGGALDNLSGAVDSAVILIGDQLAPAVQSLAEWITKLVNQFNNLSEGSKKFVVFGAALTAVLSAVMTIGGFFLMFIGSVATGLSAVGMAFAKVAEWVGKFLLRFQPAAGQVGILTKGLGFLGRAIGILSGPIGWLISFLVILAQTFVTLYKKHEVFRNEFLTNWKMMTDAVGNAVNGIKNLVVPIFQQIRDAVIPMVEALKNAVSKAFSGIESISNETFNRLGNYLAEKLVAMRAVFDSVYPYLEKVVSTTWGLISEFTQVGVDTLVGLINSVTQLLEGDWKGAWQTASDAVSGGFEGIDTIIYGIIDKIIVYVVDKIIYMKDQAMLKFVEWGTAISEWFNSIPSMIVTALVGWGVAINTWAAEQKAENIRQFTEWGISISEWFNSIPTKISEWLAGWLASIALWFLNTKNNIVKKIAEWGVSIGTWFNEMPAKIAVFLANWWTIISKWFSEIPAKITAKLAEWLVAIKTWFDGMPNDPAIKGAGMKMVDKLSEGNAEKKKTFIDKLGKIIVDVAGAALGLAAIALIAAGRELIIRIIEGVTNKKAELQEKVAGIVESIKTVLGAIDLYETGKNIIAGLIRGIGSKVKGAADAALGVAKSVGGIFTGFFKINSPSRYMENFIGGNMMNGWIKGIIAMKQKVMQTAQTAADWMTPIPAIPDYPIPETRNYSQKLNEDMKKTEKDMAETEKKPAQVVLNLGGRHYETFVDDITDSQERKQYTLKLFKPKG